MTIFFGKDVINGIDKFYQQEVDICLDCRNELRDKTASMEYEFVQDKQYSAINPDEYNVQVTYEEVENPTGSPAEQSWYEKANIDYVLSLDEQVDLSKTYYIHL